MITNFHRSLFNLLLLGFAAISTFAAEAGHGKFRPDEPWMDDKGVPIHAHGGGNYGMARAALVVSDKATGPYSYVGSFRPNKGVLPFGLDPGAAPDPIRIKNRNKWKEVAVAGDFVRRDLEGGQMSRDMTLFVDDDRKGYLLSSGEDNLTLQLHESTDDYRGFSGKWTRILPNASTRLPHSSTAPENTTSSPPAPRAGFPTAIDGRYVWLPVEWENDRRSCADTPSGTCRFSRVKTRLLSRRNDLTNLN
jgi:hypothetical protein